MLNKKNFSVRALLGAGFPLLASLTFAGAQTVPIHSYSAASYPATTPYYAPVSTVGYSTISPTIVPATATYDVLYNTYAVTPPTAAPIQPCPVLNDYDAYFAQLYGHASGASANGCVTSTNPTVYPTVVTYQPQPALPQPPLPVVHYGQSVPQQSYGVVQAPAVPVRKFAPQPVVVTTTQQQAATTSAAAVEAAVASAVQSAPEPQAAASSPQSRFRFSTNLALQLGYEARYDIQPAPTQLHYDGFASLSIDRRNGTYTAQTQVEDPNATLSKAYLNAQAPSAGDFVAQAALADQYGNSLDVYLDSQGGTVPVTIVRNPTSLAGSSTASATGEYVGDSWSVGATVGVDFTPSFSAQAPTLASASAFVNTNYGTLSVGRGLGLPYSTRAYEVISGGGYSFADLGTYQASYVSPVVANTRVGVVAGLQTRQFAGTAEYQTTRGNNQFRAGAYADTARSIQGELGYTRALGNQRFVGGTVYAGRDGSGESFYGVQGNIDVGRHSLQANATRVRSNNLTIAYGSDVTEQAVLGVEINDKESFNQQSQLNLEYSFQATPNLQLYANAEWIDHKYYGSTQAAGGGIRASF